MSCSKVLLSKKGVLGTVWVAAVSGVAALSRDQVVRTNVVACVGKRCDAHSSASARAHEREKKVRIFRGFLCRICGLGGRQWNSVGGGVWKRGLSGALGYRNEANHVMRIW
jgi:hypothetical protein